MEGGKKKRQKTTSHFPDHALVFSGKLRGREGESEVVVKKQDHRNDKNKDHESSQPHNHAEGLQVITPRMVYES